jgi:hypothetical protein
MYQLLEQLIPFWIAVSLGVFAGSRLADIHLKKRRSQWRFLLYPLPVLIGIAIGWSLMQRTSNAVYLLAIYGLSTVVGFLFVKPAASKNLND